MSRPRRVVGAVLVAVVVVLTWRYGPTLLLGIDEGAVPRVAQARLPPDVVIDGVDVLCGSGGCWNEIVVRWPGHTSDELRAHLRIDGEPPRERCQPASIIDRRVLCLYEIVIATPPPDGVVRVGEAWHRSGR